MNQASSENSKLTPATTVVEEVQYLEAFFFLFRHPNAGMNLLFLTLCFLIPIIGPIVVLGWQVKVFQRLVERHPQPIPRFDFSDFLYYLETGLIPFVVGLVIVLPLTFIFMIVFYVLGFGFAFLFSQGGEPGVGAIIGIGIAFLFLFGGIIGIHILYAAALTRAYLTQNFGQCFEFGKLFDYFKKTWLRFVGALILYGLLAFLLMILGMLALFIGIYPAVVIANVAWLYIMWQIYERYVAEGGEAIPLNPDQKPIPSGA